MISKPSLIITLVLLGTVVALDVTGGLEKEQPADEHIRKVVRTVKGLIKNKYPGEMTDIEPVGYRTQVVSGMNYFVKAVVTQADGVKKHVHLRIYKPISNQAELTAIKMNVDERSPLQYFQ